jgi:hypothetical protein
MNGWINAQAKGWLSFFGMKEQGNNPRQFEERLRGSFTMNGFYQTSDESSVYQPSSLAAGVYITGGPIVPEGHGWWVAHYACNAFSAANTYAECTAAVAPSEFLASNLAMAVAQKGTTNSVSGTLGAGVASSAYIDYQNPFWMPPGSQFTPLYVAIGAANVDFRLFIRYRTVSI